MLKISSCGNSKQNINGKWHKIAQDSFDEMNQQSQREGFQDVFDYALVAKIINSMDGLFETDDMNGFFLSYDSGKEGLRNNLLYLKEKSPTHFNDALIRMYQSLREMAANTIDYGVDSDVQNFIREIGGMLPEVNVILQKLMNEVKQNSENPDIEPPIV